MKIDIGKDFKSLKKKYDKYKGKYKDKIEELNDKSVQKLKIAKLLADDITLKWLGILMFAITTVVVTVISNFLSFGIASVLNNEKHYFFQYLVPRLFGYFWLYLIAYTVVGFLYFKMRFTIKASFGELEKGQKGDMRLATKKEIREQYRSVPEKDGFFKKEKVEFQYPEMEMLYILILVIYMLY